MGHTINKDIELEDDEIIDLIVEDSDEEQILDVIKGIDSKVGDWDFTRTLVKYFLKDLIDNEDDEAVEEFFKELGYVKVKSKDEEEDDEDDEDGEEEAEPAKVEEHNHIFRDGVCWCGDKP